MVMMWSNPALTSIWARSFMLMLPRRRILAGELVLLRGGRKREVGEIAVSLTVKSLSRGLFWGEIKKEKIVFFMSPKLPSLELVFTLLPLT